jgi:hypothetical protein
VTTALAARAFPGVRVPRRRGLRLPLVVPGALLAVLVYASLAGYTRAPRVVAAHRSVAPTHVPIFGDHPVRHPATVPAHLF